MAQRKRRTLFIAVVALALAYLVVPYGCAPGKSEMVRPGRYPTARSTPNCGARRTRNSSKAGK